MKIKILILLTFLCFNIFSSVYSQGFLAAEDDSEKVKEEKEIMDKLKDYNRAEIEKLALAADDLMRADFPKEILILRGLREIIDKLTDDAIKKIIADAVVNNKGKFDLVKLEDISGIKASTSDHQLSKYLGGLSKENLIKIALESETYSRKRQGQEDFDGGLHDYIDSLNEKAIITIIQKFVENFPELGENGLFQAFTKGDHLLANFEVKDLLEKEEKDDLAELAILCEDYERKKNNLHLIGGLHDFVFSISKKEVIKIILDFVTNNPELAFEGRLANMHKTGLKSTRPIIGGIEDYLHLFSLSELRKLGLACETYANEKKGPIMGGLHDYINSLGREEIARIISDYLIEFPELRKVGVLEGKAGINKGGLYSILFAKEMEELKNICLKLEKYQQQKTGIELDGGLHDYIEKLDKEDLIEYVRVKGDNYPSIIELGGLDKALKEVKFETY